MFTYGIYVEWISQPDSFWTGTHIAVLWGMGIVFDVLLLFVLWTAVLSAATLTSRWRVWGAAGLMRLARTMARVDRVVILLACLALALMIGVTFFSVIGRTVWKPIPDDYTFAEWSLVLTVALMLGVIQGRGEHIEVTALADTLSDRTNRFLRLLGVLAGVVAVSRLAWVSMEEVPDSFLEVTYGSIYNLPMWPARLTFMLGVGWWLARTAAQVLILPVTETVAPEDAGAPSNWDLTPLLPAHSGGEVETSGEFLDLKPADEKTKETRDGA
ncbi:MAG: TRAP transporter small permease [Pseudomonadota bacterium]